MRRTWAPRGRTPLVRHLYRHDKVSVCGGLTLSPKRHRPGLLLRFLPENFKGEDAADFLRQVLRHLRGHVVVVWDNGSIHKVQAVREVCRNPRLHLVSLPPYAPELNPIEGLWGLAKGRLANGCPADATELLEDLLDVLYGIARSPDHLRGFIRQSDLAPFFN